MSSVHVASNAWTPAATVLLLPLLGLLMLYVYNTPSSLKDTRRRHLPPGPKGLPFIGNLLDLADTEKVREKAIEWQRNHGEIFYTKIGGSDYIWLSSPRTVKELMDKKSSVYSSRAPQPMAADTVSGGQRQLFMAYGASWRQLRKYSHALLNATAAIKYQPIQDFESKQLMKELLDDPENFYMHNRRYSASVIMKLTYGFRLPTWDHPVFKRVYQVLDNFTNVSAPGAFMVDSFPSLARLPESWFGNWRTRGRKMFEHDSRVYLDLWENLKKEVDAGTAEECFCKDFYVNDPARSGINDLQAAYTCGGLIEAGSETTGTTLNNFLLCMVLHPQAVKEAQEEIDRVIGSNRLPVWEDEKNLPYVRALVKEVLRWRPVNKFGMPHATSEDDWYEGYFIPKGSVIMLNWWAIHMDESLHENARAFNPSRYLDSPLPAADYMNVSDPYQRDHFTYGAGRRGCPGVHVAERSLFINIVRTLWGFNIEKTRDIAGNVMEPETEMYPGFLSVPKPFEASIRVRSPQHEKVIREAYQEAQSRGINFKQ
ncbi:cytochrome P450 [Exophiala viscosa]|uniref:Cytochrome P450 n=1 Tax=Exophiala viscosa TaxID=2486360 RepID=A0AAN6I8A5_9EURO|nr:cytochrome P450 [Exophiala viscosa]